MCRTKIRISAFAAIISIVLAFCLISYSFNRAVLYAAPDLPGTVDASTFLINWTSIDRNSARGSTFRTKVEGGWLVIVSDEAKGLMGLTFVPDADHSWKIPR